MVADILARWGIGGFYRYTRSSRHARVCIAGPFYTRTSANPTAGARIYFVSTTVKFHFRHPKGAHSPPRIS